MIGRNRAGGEYEPVFTSRKRFRTELNLPPSQPANPPVLTLPRLSSRDRNASPEPDETVAQAGRPGGCRRDEVKLPRGGRVGIFADVIPAVMRDCLINDPADRPRC